MKKIVCAALMLISGVIGSNSAQAIDGVEVAVGVAFFSLGIAWYRQGEHLHSALKSQEVDSSNKDFLLARLRSVSLKSGGAMALGLLAIKNGLCS